MVSVKVDGSDDAKWQTRISEMATAKGRTDKSGQCQKDCADWTDSAVDQKCAVLC